MERKSKLTIAIATALLAALGAAAVYAQDKYSLKSPSGIAFSDFKGYEDWSVVSAARTDEVLKVIVANPAMINAYKAGVPGNGQPFPDGSKIAKLRGNWGQTERSRFLRKSSPRHKARTMQWKTSRLSPGSSSVPRLLCPPAPPASRHFARRADPLAIGVYPQTDQQLWIERRPPALYRAALDACVERRQVQPTNQFPNSSREVLLVNQSLNIDGTPTHLLSVHPSDQRLVAYIFWVHAASLRHNSFFARMKIKGFLHGFFFKGAGFGPKGGTFPRSRLERISQQSLSLSQWLKTTIKASDAKQQQNYSRLWCSEGFVNKTDDYADDSPLDEVSHSLSQSEFQPDVQVHVVVQHKSANHENANENAEARSFRSARSALMYHCEKYGDNQDR
jgi:hypothetical protein